MQPGWYSHVQDPRAVAYFDGFAWGPVTDGFSLSPEIHRVITPLLPGHSGPPAPFEMLAIKGTPTPKPGAGWFWGVGAGAALIVMGLLTGFSPAGSDCGSPFNRDNRVAKLKDALSSDYGLGITSYAAECKESIDAASTWTWVLIIVGVLVLLGSVIIRAILRSTQPNRETNVRPTIASQIEDLARLRDQGLITPEEFEWKRMDILRRD